MKVGWGNFEKLGNSPLVLRLSQVFTCFSGHSFIWTSQEPLDPEAQVRIEGLKEQVLKLQAMLRQRCAEADGQAIGCRWQVIFVRRIHVIH